MNIEPNPTVTTSARTRRTILRKHMSAVPVLIAVLAGSAVGATATDDTNPDDTELDGFVTEEVEPGVERIISDGAGHDLDERHPTYRLGMEDVAVTPDGTVWLWSSYQETDREAHGLTGLSKLMWALGEPGMSELPDVYCETVPEEDGLGLLCIDTPEGVGTTYLAGTLINEVLVAPDGTIWAVGDYGGGGGGGGGGLYRITHERLTTN
jgi:hypothetical protein